jgi:acyl-CoA synthetase (AMP-forming)/AMP-acid ligase II
VLCCSTPPVGENASRTIVLFLCVTTSFLCIFNNHAGPEFILAFIACLYSGVIAVPVYPPVSDVVYASRGSIGVKGYLTGARASLCAYVSISTPTVSTPRCLV